MKSKNLFLLILSFIFLNSHLFAAGTIKISITPEYPIVGDELNFTTEVSFPNQSQYIDVAIAFLNQHHLHFDYYYFQSDDNIPSTHLDSNRTIGNLPAGLHLITANLYSTSDASADPEDFSHYDIIDSDTIIFEITEFPISIARERENENYFSIYPNPTKEYINISLPTSEKNNHKIQILDALGREVLNYNIEQSTLSKDEIQINISSLKNGLYFVILKNEHAIISRKFIKQ